jgi:hypothetical protein
MGTTTLLEAPMNKEPTKQQVGNPAMWRDNVETRCHCGRTIARCAATYVSFVDEEGMKTGEEQTTCVVLNCHAQENGQFAQTLMVALFPTAVAA